MRFHDFDLVVLDELFGTRDPEMNHVLKYISQLTMDSRRGMFVILVSDRFMTGDNMQAFHKSVNLIVNPQEIHQFGMIMKRGLGEHEAFYRIFTQEFEKLNGI
jgi:hypoxanthine phosphoribosyltransferase